MLVSVRFLQCCVLTAALCVFAVARPAAAQQTAFDTAAVLASARHDVEAANAAWLPGLRDRNAASIAEAYADSGVFVGADGSVTRGRAAVERMYEARFPRLGTIVGGGVVQDGVTAVAPDLLYEWGHAWLEMQADTPGAAPARTGGRYLTVWRREPDGHWRIVRNLAM
jgi:uncharacterized protein (TIGR02246 family)